MWHGVDPEIPRQPPTEVWCRTRPVGEETAVPPASDRWSRLKQAEASAVNLK